jgi:hypothetical protein
MQAQSCQGESKRTGRFRLLLSAAALCLISAAAFSPFVRWLSPDLALALALRGHGPDPWGNGLLLSSPVQPEMYSAGPNKEDERGLGDDVLVKDALRWSRQSTSLLLWTPETLAGLALTLLWCGFAPPLARASRSDRLGLEFVRAAVLASGPALLVLALLRWDLTTKNSGVAYFLPRRVPLSLRLPGSEALVVPTPIALAGSLLLLTYLVALALRLRTPRAGDVSL